MTTSPHARRPPVAVIDIGTNSIKLVVARAEGTGLRRVHFASATTRLGEGLGARGTISRAASERTARAVASLAADARRHGAKRVVAVGTWAFRVADNGREVARRISLVSRVPVRVLSGPEEARCAFLSARAYGGRARPASFLLDIGGGSAQFIVARGERVVSTRSLPLGALHLTERYLHQDPIDPAEHARMRAEIDRTVARAVAPHANLAPRASFLAVGGSAVTALAMARPGRPPSPRGVLKRSDLRRVEAVCLARTIAQRKRLPGLSPDRADIIPAGLAVVLAFMTATGKRVAHVSAGGVREGVILAMHRE